jgi:hypothetical protein
MLRLRFGRSRLPNLNPKALTVCAVALYTRPETPNDIYVHPCTLAQGIRVNLSDTSVNSCWEISACLVVGATGHCIGTRLTLQQNIIGA